MMGCWISAISSTPFRAEKYTSFRRIIGRLSIPRVKRYPIPAQNPSAKHSARKMRQNPAQNPPAKHSARKLRQNPAQNLAAKYPARNLPATLLAQKLTARKPIRRATSAPGKQRCLRKQQIPQISDTIHPV